MTTKFLLFRQSLNPLEGDRLIAIVDTGTEARLLLDKPNFDIRIVEVRLDANGLIKWEQEIL